MRLDCFSSSRPRIAALAVVTLIAAFGCDQNASSSVPARDNPAETAAAEAPKPPASIAEPAASEEPAPVASAAPADSGEPAEPKATDAKTAAVATAKAPDTTGDKAAPKEPEATKGADVTAAAFSTWLQSSGNYEAGKQGAVTAVLVAKDPYKCNAKYPYKFKLDAPSDGVSYPESTVRGAQVAHKRATMSIPFLPSKAGKATISGQLSFSICTDERCVIEKRPLSVTVDVK